MTRIQVLAAAIAGALLAAPAWDGAIAQEKNKKTQKKRTGGLAGSEGDVKRKVMFMSTSEGGCQGVYRRYVAAGGHSAFAATNIDYFYGDPYVCGAGFNAPSQKEAERRAIAQCDQGRINYKKQNKSLALSGRCTVHASK